MIQQLKAAPMMLFALVLLTGCAKIYTAPQATSVVRKHKTIAVVPPVVSIAAQRKVDPQALRDQEVAESLNFHQEMVSWLLRRRQQNRIAVDIQDANTTLTLLERAGYDGPRSMTNEEIAEALGVDGIVSANFSLTKPMTQGAAIVTTVLFGFGSANEVGAMLSLYNADDGGLLWSYNHKLSGGIVSSPSVLVDNLMRNASKKMPYTAALQGR